MVMTGSKLHCPAAPLMDWYHTTWRARVNQLFMIKKFIKVLLVACIGLEKVRIMEHDPLKTNFIKGI